MDVSAEHAFVILTSLLLGCAVLMALLPVGLSWRSAALCPAPSLYGWLAMGAFAACLAWVGGYHLSHTQVGGEHAGVLKFFVPDDSAQINYSGTFIGDGAQPASSASWLWYVMVSFSAMALLYAASSPWKMEWPPLVCAIAVGGVLLPFAAAWSWHDGWLERAGLVDSSGAVTLHVMVGAAALAWLMAMKHRGYVAAATTAPFVPLSRGGAWLCWIGLLVLSLGLQLEQARAIDAVWMALGAGNLAAASLGGVVAGFVLLRSPRFAVRDDLPLVGLLAGLVSLSADPLSPSLPEAAAIGAVGTLAATLMAYRLRQRALDDRLGMVSIHLGAGLWAAVAVCFVNPVAALKMQLIGIGSCAALGWAGMAATAVLALAVHKIRARQSH